MLVVDHFTDRELSAAVVIPSYQEGRGLIPSLASVARQRGIDLNEIAVFVVVNNTSSAAADVLNSNAETIGIIKDIWAGRIPDGLNDASVVIHGQEYSELESYRYIIKSDLRVVLVDLSTEGHAPDTCNVGVARDIGGRVALDYLSDDGILIATDADTLLAKDYVSGGLKFFQANPSVAAATGPCEAYELWSRTEMHDAVKLGRLEANLKSALSMYFEEYVAKSIDKNEDVVMGGANMAVRASVFREVGGIPRLSGGEDTLFTLGILNRGLAIRAVPDLAVLTQARISLRTDVNAGFGQTMKRMQDHGPRYADFQTFSMETTAYVERLLLHIDMANAAGDEIEWKRIMGDAELQLSDGELDALWKENSRAPKVRAALNHFLVKAVWKVAETHCPKTDLATSLSGLKASLLAEEGEDIILGSIIDVETKISDLHRSRRQMLTLYINEYLDNYGDKPPGFSFEHLRSFIGVPRNDIELENINLQNDVAFVHSILTLKSRVEAVQRFRALSIKISSLLLVFPDSSGEISILATNIFLLSQNTVEDLVNRLRGVALVNYILTLQQEHRRLFKSVTKLINDDMLRATHDIDLYYRSALIRVQSRNYEGNIFELVVKKLEENFADLPEEIRLSIGEGYIFDYLEQVRVCAELHKMLEETLTNVPDSLFEYGKT